MDPGRREAVLAMADAPADTAGRKDVTHGYEGDGYMAEAMAASWAWFSLVAAENIVGAEFAWAREYGLYGIFRDGEEL